MTFSPRNTFTVSSLVLLTLLLIGCEERRTAPAGEGVSIAFFVASDEAAPALEARPVRGEDRELHLPPEPFLTEAHVRGAEVAESDYGDGLRLLLTDEGRQRLLETTSANIGRPLAIAVNGEVISAPIVRDAIDSGELLVTGSLGSEEIELIAASINASS